DGVFTGIVVQFKGGYLVWLDQPSFIGNGNLYLKTPVARVDGIAHAVYLSLEFLSYGSDLHLHFGAFADAAEVVFRDIGLHIHFVKVDDAEEFHLPRRNHLPLFGHPLVDDPAEGRPDDAFLYLRLHLLYRILKRLVIQFRLQVLDLGTYLLFPEAGLPFEGGFCQSQLRFQTGELTGESTVIYDGKDLTFAHVLAFLNSDFPQDSCGFRIDDDVLVRRHIS